MGNQLHAVHCTVTHGIGCLFLGQLGPFDDVQLLEDLISCRWVFIPALHHLMTILNSCFTSLLVGRARVFLLSQVGVLVRWLLLVLLSHLFNTFWIIIWVSLMPLPLSSSQKPPYIWLSKKIILISFLTFTNSFTLHWGVQCIWLLLGMLQIGWPFYLWMNLHGVTLHAAFQDALAVRHGWSPLCTPAMCICGASFSV